MFSFNLILTERCNAVCTHCYMSANEKTAKKTMSRENLSSIIEKFPIDTKTVVFTGGEVYLEKDLLYFAINAVHQKNPNIEIGVESNGIWFYKNLEIAQKELEHLKSAGVAFIRFSDDIFHSQGGVDLEKVRALKILENDNTPKLKYLVQSQAFGIGRAESLPEELKSKNNCMNSSNSISNPYLFLDIDGNVFSCAWKCCPKIGNMIHDSWDSIVDSLSEPTNNLILQGKIEEAASNNSNLTIQDCEAISQQEGQCKLCFDTFNGR